MIQVVLSKIIIDEKRQEQVIVLKEKDGTRQFPIVIGFLEASSIKMKISHIEPPRPLTHDLTAKILEALEVQIHHCVIDKMVENTYHAKIELKTKDGHRKLIDCRPSDGIALAVRTSAQMFVKKEIFEKSAVTLPE